MKNRTLLYYMNHNNDSLTPSDMQVSDIYTEDWWIWLKPHFSDLIWQYYSSRVVFINDRFEADMSDEDIIRNIIRSFAINLNTRNYEYKTLYNTTQLEYNPIWNVDGVTGTIHESTTDETIDATKTGTDTTSHTGNDTVKHTGHDDLDKSGYDTNDNNNSRYTGVNGNTHDSDVQVYNNTYDSIDTDPPAEFPHDRTHTLDTDKIDEHGTDYTRVEYHSKDKTTYLSDDKTIYQSDLETTYDTADNRDRNEYRKDLDLVIRQGNQGITMTQQMIDAERNVAMFNFFKKVVHDCVNTCTYAID